MTEDASSTTNTVGPSPYRVGFGSKELWGPAITVLVVVVVFSIPLLTGSGQMSVRTIIPFLIFIPFGVSLVFTVLRTLRGLTLDADGITWHAKEIFVPWANVSAVRIGSDLTRPDARTDTDLKLVVDVLHLDLVAADLRNHRRRTVINNEKRFGGPIALPVAKLNVPAEEVIAAAERIKAEAGSASTSAPDQDKFWSHRERAVIVMRTADTLGGMGLMIGLMFLLFR